MPLAYQSEVDPAVYASRVANRKSTGACGVCLSRSQSEVDPAVYASRVANRYSPLTCTRMSSSEKVQITVAVATLNSSGAESTVPSTYKRYKGKEEQRHKQSTLRVPQGRTQAEEEDSAATLHLHPCCYWHNRRTRKKTK
eukprot:1189540-Prorocentrum_minimum.AAC.4